MKTILVPVDFSNATGKIIETVKTLANALETRVVLLHVKQADSLIPNIDMQQIPTAPSSFLPAQGIIHLDDPAKTQQRLDELKLGFAGMPFEVTTRQNEGTPEEMILEACEQEAADMIIMGSHGHGAVYNLLMGSVTSGVLKSAKCPVLVVPSPRDR